MKIVYASYNRDDFTDDIYPMRLARKHARQERRGKHAKKQRQAHHDKG